MYCLLKFRNNFFEIKLNHFKLEIAMVLPKSIMHSLFIEIFLGSP